MVQSGGIGVQQATRLPPAASPPRWRSNISTSTRRSALGEIGSQGGSQGGSTPAGGYSSYLPERRRYVPARCVLSRDLDDVTLDISRRDNGWGFPVDSRQIAGALRRLAAARRHPVRGCACA